MNIGKCPKCEKQLTSVSIETMDVKQGFQSAYKGVSYLCPFCNSILSVGLDPIALNADMINGVVKALKSR